MFSAALGLLGGIGSIIMGGYQYSLGLQELQLKRKALNDQRDFGMLNYGLAKDQLAKEREQEEYLRKMNERNMLNQALERSKIEAQRRQRLKAYQDERQYVAERQVAIDRAQAEQYAIQLESYLQNKDLAKEERELALSYLDEAKAVAAGERDDDLTRLRLERLTAQQERDFAISEMRGAQSIAATERLDDLNYRDRILGQLNEMSGRLQEAYNGMGALSAPAGVNEAEILATIARYEDNAQANVDRAADRVASQAEASLIDSGMSRSTAGEMRRGEIARKLALEYDNARLAARNQAMDYIKGKEALKDAAFQRQVAARGTQMQEIGGLYEPIIQGLINSRQTLSANNYNAPVAIGSGNVLRDVLSANQYASPIGINTAMTSPTGLSSRMGQTLNMPSVADAYVTTGDYNQFQPQMWNLTGPSGFMSNASTLIGNIAGQYTPATFMEMGMNTMGGGFSALGGALTDFSKSGTYQQTTAMGTPAMGATGYGTYNPYVTPHAARIGF